jgi:hypothetical protein
MHRDIRTVAFFVTNIETNKGYEIPPPAPPPGPKKNQFPKHFYLCEILLISEANINIAISCEVMPYNEAESYKRFGAN